MAKIHTHRGRGATFSADNRYSEFQKEAFDDGWGESELQAQIPTSLMIDNAKKVITYNQSPDLPFDRSINPYRGCEHGCVYCFARPSHAWLDLSPGLDFETKLFYKPEAPNILRQELAHKNYRCSPIALGVNTDAYQPVDKKTELTREIIEVLIEHNHPFSIITKSSLIERDIDLLAIAAEKHLVEVSISLTTLDQTLSLHMEPRAAAPQRRLQTINTLSRAGIPVNAFLAPIIPVLNDHEMENLLVAARNNGAIDAVYILLRLPLEVDDLFCHWLAQYAPTKVEHVMARVRDLRGGKHYDTRFGHRMKGVGVYANLLAQRFKLAYQKCAFPGGIDLRSDAFCALKDDRQLSLF